jgi:hypothetical protein
MRKDAKSAKTESNSNPDYKFMFTPATSAVCAFEFSRGAAPEFSPWRKPLGKQADHRSPGWGVRFCAAMSYAPSGAMSWACPSTRRLTPWAKFLRRSAAGREYSIPRRLAPWAKFLRHSAAGTAYGTGHFLEAAIHPKLLLCIAPSLRALPTGHPHAFPFLRVPQMPTFIPRASAMAALASMARSASSAALA